MVVVCGIDEVGRGAVIGPLVMAGVLIEEEKIPKLLEIGVKDSKLLTPKQREKLFPQIKKIIKDFKVIQIPPKEIDDALESDSLNLNWLEAHKSAEIINALKPNKAIIDSPSNNVRAYKNYLVKLLKNKKIEISVEHKAEKHPPVAAASILAKVIRDNEIEKIKKKYGNCGPGYSSNLITQEFIKENFKKYPEIFRKTWITYKRLKVVDENTKLTDFK